MLTNGAATNGLHSEKTVTQGKDGAGIDLTFTPKELTRVNRMKYDIDRRSLWPSMKIWCQNEHRHGFYGKIGASS